MIKYVVCVYHDVVKLLLRREIFSYFISYIFCGVSSGRSSPGAWGNLVWRLSGGILTHAQMAYDKMNVVMKVVRSSP